MDTELIDIHTHILPGMDDGAQDLKDAVAMAAVASRDGIKKLVATPHVMRGAFDNSREQILKKVQELNLCLEVQKIKVTILPGAEYYLEPDLPARLAAGELLTLNDTGRYLLIEFPATGVPNNACEIVDELLAQGVIPIIAHPERNHQLSKYPGMVGRFSSRGVLSQVTSGSITGIHGKAVQESALQFIQMGVTQFVASDAHSNRTRSPVLTAAFAEVEKRWGQEIAMLLFCRNPWRVLRGRPIIQPELQGATEPAPSKSSAKPGWMQKKLRMPWA